MIDVAFLTWPVHGERTWSFATCYARARRFLSASKHQLRWHLSCETQDVADRDIEGVKRLAMIDGMNLNLRQGAADLGSAMNAAHAMCDAPWRIVIQDDMLLLDHLDLSMLVNFLERQPEYLCVRGGWAHTRFSGNVEVMWKPTNANICYYDTYRSVDIHGPFPLADEPFLCRRDFFDTVGGKYAEGMPHGASEGEMVRRVAGKHKIATLPHPIFVHAGVPSCIASRDYKKLQAGEPAT